MEKEAELFVNGARKAGLPDCVPASKLTEMPNLLCVKSCELKRPRHWGNHWIGPSWPCIGQVCFGDTVSAMGH